MFNRPPHLTPEWRPFFAARKPSLPGQVYRGITVWKTDRPSLESGTPCISYVYEGLATLELLALYERQPPAELTSQQLPIRLRNVGATRLRVEFDR
jgi:hypothetical protein